MDNKNQANQNFNTPLPENKTGKNKDSAGPTIGIVIIILILVLGAIYIFTNRHDNNIIPEEEVTEEDLLNQSESTELVDIEADALDTDLENIDRELSDIEAELETTGY